MAREQPTAPVVAKWFGDRWIELRPLGKGGMGKVFMAFGGGRICAIKVSNSVGDPRERSRRFMAEVKLAAKFSHRNLAFVIEAGRVGQQEFLAMEYVRGKTLFQLLERCSAANAPVGMGTALFIVREVLEGLSYLHHHADPCVLHGDISSTNVMLAYDGSVKVIDLGLAVRSEIDHLNDTTSREKTRSVVTIQSDIFSVGVLLWELLTGRPLFRSGVPRTGNDEIPTPSSLCPEIPSSLDGVIMTALATKPSDRFKTTDHFRKALQEFDLPGQDNAAVADMMNKLFGEDRKRESAEEKGLTEVAEAMQLATTGRKDSPPKSRRSFVVAIFIGTAALAIVTVLMLTNRKAGEPTRVVAIPISAKGEVEQNAPRLAGVAAIRNDDHAIKPKARVTVSSKELLQKAEMAFRLDQLSQAELYANAALKSAPLEAHLLLGKILLHADDPSASAKHYRAALAIKPDFAPAKVGLSLAESRLGKDL